MKALVENLAKQFDAFKVDAAKAADGNKAAGMRARKVSLAIEKDLKLFRKQSVK